MEECFNIQGLSINGIITEKRTFSISYSKNRVKNIIHADFSGFARSGNIPYVYLKNSMKEDDLFDQVLKWQPDIFLL